MVPQAKGKCSESDKYIQKGPFKYKSTETYFKLSVSISAVLPYLVLNIVEAKITQKCQTPQNLASLPLGGETSYSTMIEALQAKKAGSQVGMIMMPPPVRPAERPVCVLCVFLPTTSFNHSGEWIISLYSSKSSKHFNYAP